MLLAIRVMLMLLAIRVMLSRVSEMFLLSSVCLSVHLSVPYNRCMPQQRVCCCGPGSQEISIDRDVAQVDGQQQAQCSGVPRPDAGITTLSADMGS